MTARAEDPHIGLIVEGAGDKGAVPELLRRRLYERGEFRDLLGKPIPLNGKSSATADGGIERFVATASLRPGCRAVLVILDADDKVSCEEGPHLLKRAETQTTVPVVIALAERDFEDWIYCSAETLDLGLEEYNPTARGLRQIKDALHPRAYVKPTWQPRLTSRMDLRLAAQRNPSLERLFVKLEELVGLI